MSLRARLVVGLLALAALGLLVAGAVTYAEQKSFLLDRIDRQTHAALPAVSRQLSQNGANVPGYADPRLGLDGGQDAGEHDPAAANLPPGTFGQRRDAGGEVLGEVVLSYGGEPLATPDIPKHLPLVGRMFTVDSDGGGGLKYRAVAKETIGQPGLTIVAVPMAEAERTLDRLLRVEGLVIGGVLLALALISWLIVGIGLRPLDRIGETAGAIAAGDLTRRVTPVNPSTEVGRLGIALNAMLDRLEQAFAERQASENRLRRFLADTSHELRTPLQSIRGYAELFRIGAARNTADTEKAMRRVESEAARMGVVVEDLLTLARLDEVRDVIRERVDVAQLAEDAAHDARATDPTRAIDVRADERGAALGDPHQLRQVLGNLMRNALVHTPPGTPIEVSVAREDDRVVLEVRDHGPGLPANGGSDALFERFWRAEKGRTRGRAGAGLGLAIVAGIVRAHAGAVRAEDAGGGGARFVIELPAA
jgi:two-component system OmpR family sensor kinase